MNRDSEAEKMEARAQAIRAKVRATATRLAFLFASCGVGVASGNCTDWPSRKWVLVEFLCSFCESFYIHL